MRALILDAVANPRPPHQPECVDLGIAFYFKQSTTPPSSPLLRRMLAVRDAATLAAVRLRSPGSAPQPAQRGRGHVLAEGAQ